jgi:2-polyprenyl-3-methyl-5-hydroxy-6-metoxy-1,4-benzoquinol methylase
MSCLICNSQLRTIFCIKDGLTYFRCLNCGHVYVEKCLNKEDLQQYYANRRSHHSSLMKEQWDYSEIKAKMVYLPLLRKIRDFTSPGRLLDIGCSNGSFLHAAEKDGWDAYGVELEKNSYDIAQRKGLKVYLGDLASQDFPRHHFTAITLWQVIEHVVDPSEIIGEIARILRPRGIFALSTPNIRSIGEILLGGSWNAIEPQVHLNLFNLYGIENYITRFGFKVAYVETRDIKPNTITQFIRKLTKKEANRSTNSVARLSDSISEKKLKMMFQINFILNLILKRLGIGEDIYAYFRK